MICVYRNQFAGFYKSVDLEFDGQSMGKLSNDAYIKLNVKPGDHVIKAVGRVGYPSAVSLSLAPGSAAYLRVEMEWMGVVAFPNLVQRSVLSETEIRNDCRAGWTRVIDGPDAGKPQNAT